MGVLRHAKCGRNAFRIAATLAILGIAVSVWSTIIFGDFFPQLSGAAMYSMSARQGSRDPLALQENPGGGGYLVYGIFDTGDYTNKKIQLIEALAMASMANRTLVVPWLCQSEPSTYLFDAATMHSAVGIIEDTAPWQRNDNPHEHGVLLRHLCGEEGIQLKLPHGFATRQERFGVKHDGWRGVNWRTVESEKIAVDERLLPRGAWGKGARRRRGGKG